MSTGTAGSGSLSSTTAAGTSTQTAKRERYIERQLRRTRRQVRGVELASRLMLLVSRRRRIFPDCGRRRSLAGPWRTEHIWAAGVFGGVPGRRRLVCQRAKSPRCSCIGSIRCLPRRRSSAQADAQEQLAQFSLAAFEPRGVPEVVLSAVEEQAAASLERTSIEHVVDRTRLIQIGYLLLAMVAAFCTYYLLSPKSPLQTVGRVVLPWSDLQPPSRVEIDDIQPGTTTVFRGERVSISAMVNPLQEGEAVTLYFSTADRQSVDQPVRMYVTKDSYGRHTVTLPPAADAAALAVERRIAARRRISHRSGRRSEPNLSPHRRSGAEHWRR